MVTVEQLAHDELQRDVDDHLDVLVLREFALLTILSDLIAYRLVSDCSRSVIFSIDCFEHLDELLTNVVGVILEDDVLYKFFLGRQDDVSQLHEVFFHVLSVVGVLIEELT